MGANDNQAYTNSGDAFVQFNGDSQEMLQAVAADICKAVRPEQWEHVCRVVNPFDADHSVVITRMLGMGESGWELVSVVSVQTSTGPKLIHYFKRPKVVQ